MIVLLDQIQRLTVQSATVTQFLHLNEADEYAIHVSRIVLSKFKGNNLNLLLVKLV